jgi:hypothetical protein
MWRVSLGSLATVAILAAGLVLADDSKNQSKQSSQSKQDKTCSHAKISSIDQQNNKVTLQVCDKSGQHHEKTFTISDDATLRDSDGHSAKLKDFKAGDEVAITQKDGKLTEMKEQEEFTITKVDPKQGTITVKMKNKQGKEVEKTFTLVEDAEYLDSAGHVAALEVFRSGDKVLIIEGEGQLKGMKKSDAAGSTASRSNSSGSTKPSTSK